MDKTKKPFYFHDCKICKAMKWADDQGRPLSEEDLKKAFEAQKESKKKDLREDV